MNQRISLYTFESKIEHDDIVEKIIKRRYKEGSTSGFILSKVTDEVIKGRHIHKQESIMSITDPFGNTIDNRINNYVVNEFIISNGFIEIINPHKNMSYFRREILSALDNKCILDSISIDIDKFTCLLGQQFEDMYVEAIDLNTYSLFDDSFSKINVKGNKNLLSNMAKFRNNISHKITKVSINIDGYLVDASHRGAIKITSDYIDNKFTSSLISLIKESISN